jgi:hypothetical protein
MPISIGSTANTGVATTLKPIATTNHRIMVPPDLFLNLAAEKRYLT